MIILQLHWEPNVFSYSEVCGSGIRIRKWLGVYHKGHEATDQQYFLSFERAVQREEREREKGRKKGRKKGRREGDSTYTKIWLLHALHWKSLQPCKDHLSQHPVQGRHLRFINLFTNSGKTQSLISWFLFLEGLPFGKIVRLLSKARETISLISKTQFSTFWLPEECHPDEIHITDMYVFSHVQFFATPWTIAHQAPLSMGFSSLEYWSGLPRPPL